MGAIYLGLEGGATKTVAVLSNGQRRVFGPLNLKLVTDRQVLAVLRKFRPARAAICLAGCRTPADRRRLRRLARRAWPKAQSVFIGNDLDSGHAAAFGPHGAGILIISGTGSSVLGRNAEGQTARAGGWGHLLGDHGSGYWIALTGLRNAIRDYDRNGTLRPALRRVLRRLKMKSPEELVGWIHDATKADIAALAGDVMRGDHPLMLQSASFLAMDAAAVAEKLGLESPPIALAGGVLKHCPGFRRLVIHRLRQVFRYSTIRLMTRETAYGAVALAASEQPSALRSSKR